MALLSRRNLIALGGAIIALALTPAASLAAAGPSVTVRVEGLKRSLLGPTLVQTHTGWITQGGAPTGKCPATSGQGALDVATKHRWAGKFSSSLGSYFITTILGETENGPTIYWSIFVNNRSASTGGCGVKLHSGDQLLFAAAKYPEYPLGVVAPSTAKAGHSVSAKVVWFNAKGKAAPLAGATVSVGGRTAKTNNRGVVTLTLSHAGTYTVKATHAGYIRAAPVGLRVTG